MLVLVTKTRKLSSLASSVNFKSSSCQIAALTNQQNNLWLWLARLKAQRVTNLAAKLIPSPIALWLRRVRRKISYRIGQKIKHPGSMEVAQKRLSLAWHQVQPLSKLKNLNTRIRSKTTQSSLAKFQKRSTTMKRLRRRQLQASHVQRIYPNRSRETTRSTSRKSWSNRQLNFSWSDNRPYQACPSIPNRSTKSVQKCSTS